MEKIVWLLQSAWIDGQWKLVEGYTANSKEEAEWAVDSLHKISPAKKYRCVPYEQVAGDFCEACGVFVDSNDEAHQWHDGVVTCLKCGGPEAHGIKLK